VVATAVRADNILVTGGAGFIGANFVLDWFQHSSDSIINLDKLTYAGRLENLAVLRGDTRHVFVHGDIGDRDLVAHLLKTHRPRAIVNFAAETHVDRSISEPRDFVETNVVGTFRLLEAARIYLDDLEPARKRVFRFLHVSTDEVFGSLQPQESAFGEAARYAPNSPYAASKAGSDHLVRAYHRTYGMPALTTNASNNYGPYQHPEKFIPLMIRAALSDKPLPIYGDGGNIRDWLYVTDHCAGIRLVLEEGRSGESYNLGSGSEMRNVDVAHRVCDVLDRERPRADGRSYREQIAFVADRAGHDRRYVIDATKMQRELGWKARETFESGILKTVRWYLENPQWFDRGTGDQRKMPHSATMGRG
jgi:dTDP-glucose 4,6-dehydratase